MLSNQAEIAMRVVFLHNDIDRLALLAKATAELLDRGQSGESASRQVEELRDLLEALL